MFTADSRTGSISRANLSVAALPVVGFAVLPDADLFFHFHRGITHSIGAVIAVGVVAAAVALSVRRPVWRVALMCAGAYATHLILDWMAVDTLPPYGIQAFWPFSARWLISGWDLFRQTERRHFLSASAIWINLEAIAQEIAILAPIVVVLWLVRVKALARLAPELSGRHHAAK